MTKASTEAPHISSACFESGFCCFYKMCKVWPLPNLQKKQTEDEKKMIYVSLSNVLHEENGVFFSIVIKP